ncbi:MAG: TolC family protein, partial [Bacteroidetes bacterium]|nr:TolC family protein [Bacteroidota bacterium]
MSKKTSILLLGLLFRFYIVSGQDSTMTLGLEQLIKIVKEFHPIVKQSSIQIEKSKAQILVAKSNFDPQFSYSQVAKTFDGINY